MLVLLLVAALVGVGAGYAGAALGTAAPTTLRLAGPVAASDPAYPWTRPLRLRPDAELPPLATDLTLRPAVLGTGALKTQIPVPAGWRRWDAAAGRPEARWTLPDNPPGSYSVRVQRLEDIRRSLTQMVAERAVALPLDPRVGHVEFLDQTSDTLVVSFVLDGYRKLSVIRWVSLTPADQPDLEIAATGRLVDEDGLRSLVNRIADGARRISPSRKRTR